MSEELLSNERRILLFYKFILAIRVRAIEITQKMKNESVKKSLEKSKNVLEEKRKMVKQKICIKKTNTFTIIAMNFVQEQFIILKPAIHKKL